MDDRTVTAAVSAVVAVVTTAVTVLYGPSWKARVDRKRERAARSEFLLAHYSEPLLRAAYDLQSRVYNLVQLGFLARYGSQDSYASASTLWLLAQYLAWVEILRREVQLLDMGDVERTSQLQRHLFEVTHILSADSSQGFDDEVFRIFRADQRAIGELMVVERRIGDRLRSDAMGYAAFVERLKDSAFVAWFAKPTADLEVLYERGGRSSRLVRLQRALVDLVEFLDPDSVRIPAGLRTRVSSQILDDRD